MNAPNLLLQALAIVAAGVDGSPYSALVDDAGEMRIVPRSTHAAGFAPSEAAWAHFNDSYLAIGWSKLAVHGNPAMNDTVVAHAAGFIEGKLTAARILENAINNGVGPGMTPDPHVTAFFEVHNRWASGLGDVATLSSAADAQYWHHSLLVDDQLAGLHAGYQKAAAESRGALPSLPFESFLYLNIGEERETFAKFRPGMGVTPDVTFGALEPFEAAGKCSALVKLTAGSADVLIAQETWSGLASMLRIYKMYDLPFSLNATHRVPARRVSFSSYPGVLNSGDDFYVTSANLVVQETTIGNSNPELVRAYVSPLTVPEWKRNVIANRLAASGVAWSGLYAKYNSGTYNNQNIVLDYNLFTPGQPLPNGTLLLVEQIPGYVVNSDVSAVLQRDGYFGSYNVAYDPFVREVSGANAALAAGGPWFGYWTTARAQLFRRDAPGVDGLAAMQGLMRSCDFHHDALSHQQCAHGYIDDTSKFHPLGTAENCIATRGDLNPKDGKWCLSAFGHRDHVATDAKISSWSMHSDKSVPASVVAGPTWGAQSGAGKLPPFCWSTSDYNTSTSHLGHPDCFEFEWEYMIW